MISDLLTPRGLKFQSRFTFVVLGKILQIVRLSSSELIKKNDFSITEKLNKKRLSEPERKSV